MKYDPIPKSSDCDVQPTKVQKIPSLSRGIGILSEVEFESSLVHTKYFLTLRLRKGLYFMVSTETILMGLLTVLAIFIVSEGMLDIRLLPDEAYCADSGCLFRDSVLQHYPCLA